MELVNRIMNLRYVLTKMLEWRSESSEIFVLNRRLFFFGLLCFGGSVKMFCIWIIIRYYFLFLSMDIFVFFTRYSLRYLSLKLYISSMTFAFAQKLSVRPSNANSDHRSFERSHLAIRN